MEAGETSARREPALVVIVGPTASGKTSLGLRLARETGGEIVNADALQVYRGLDIGTDKPTAAMRREVRHHLVDFLDPTESYSAGDFARHGRAAIADIRARGKPALVVGGSGFYVRALLEGLSPLPRRHPEVRERLEKRLESEGLSNLFAELEAVDPEMAARLEAADWQRILRALEVFESSGTPMSHWQRRRPAEPPLEALKVGLTLPRAILYDRIADRVNHMIERGWLAEVAAMLEKGIDPLAPAFQAIGYRQLIRHLQGECSRREAIEETIRATRRYAKRQHTWFRREPSIRWISSLETEQALPDLLRDITFQGALAR